MPCISTLSIYLFTLHNILWVDIHYHYPDLTDEETEVQRIT